MIDLSLAVRNLLRNRRRSFATFIALAIGTSSILLFGGYRKNIEYSMHTAYVRDGGHLQIQHSDIIIIILIDKPFNLSGSRQIQFLYQRT